MKSFFEIEAFVVNVKTFNYSKGVGYNFSFAMNTETVGEDGKAAVVWISGVSFNKPLLDKRNYLLRGKLQVKLPYKNYPAGLQMIVEEAFELGEGRYVVRTKRDAPKEAEAHSTSNGMNDPSPNQVRQHERTEETHANKDPMFPEMNEEIPF